MDPITGVIAFAIANPEITLAVAQVGLAVLQEGFNFFAGQKNLDKEKEDLKKQETLATQAHNQQVEQIGQQFDQGKKDVLQANGGQAADMASRGVTGDFASGAVADGNLERTAKLDQWNTNAVKSEGLRWAGVQDQFQAGYDGIQSQRDQLGMNALLSLGGVGLSAAGAIMRAPAAPKAAVDGGSAVTDLYFPKKAKNDPFGLQMQDPYTDPYKLNF